MTGRRQKWVFGSHNGLSFADNSRALFEYSHRSGSENIRYIWLTRNNGVASKLKRIDPHYEVHTFFSIAGMYHALTAKVIVLTSSFGDVGPFAYLFSSRKSIVQLWHGTPLKRLENMKIPFLKQVAISLLIKIIGRDCDYVVSASDINIPIYRNSFRVQDSQIIVAGQPRNDVLVSGAGLQRDIWYLPTFREYDRDINLFSDYGFDPQKLSKILAKFGAILHLKLHHVDALKVSNYSQQLANSTNIKLSNPEDLYAELAKSQLLITDYSSVYFDYLLTNKPIIFAPFDLDKYAQNRGFYYDYESVTPGPKVHNWDTLCDVLESILSGTDTWRHQRQIINNTFNRHQDANSARRVYDILAHEVGHEK